MGLFEQFGEFVTSPSSSPASQPRKTFFDGGGDYDFPVVSESHYQDNLDFICGGRTKEGHEFLCEAALVLEDENPHDSQAVRVDASGLTVGHLSKPDAQDYRRRLAEMGQPRLPLSRKAVIRGGWDRGDGDKGNFGIWLDLPWQSHAGMRPVAGEGPRIPISVLDFFMVPTPSGYDLYRESGLVPWMRLRPDDPVWAFKIVGIEFREDGPELLDSEAFAPGSRVVLRREPENEHDKNGVRILDASGEGHVGYVPAEWAEELAGRMDAGEDPGAWVVWERQERGKRKGAWIMVLEDGVTIDWEEQR